MSEHKLNKHVDQFTAAIDQVQQALGPMLQQPLGEVIPRLSTIQRCELEALVAYSIDTLFWIFLKVNGVAAKEHPVMKELQRVQRYIAKIKAAKSGSDEENSSSKQDDSRRSMQVDKKAADRVIRNAISTK
ncbi:hypothetical protein GGI04_000821 [Coemansia thaxteri]|uniref:Exosome complex protein n=1 Tax=Coemansia thaxteri TaxID=2663907 RepID=A0A9W8BKV1_9FUNG|nr:hypothetical protein H4R26_000009 [Coemansia thaxteri]KAJ2008979.1 hypothetical protein GGI04_000821 [Coemansia thaxteri]KAJ2473906.1 hypothetical protein GGI02_000525 [Coemansia sp. RSA 2322]KAJ2485628.1 hypothetical protein EV174_001602 [Coemansia sp. RSA 2320]